MYFQARRFDTVEDDLKRAMETYEELMRKEELEIEQLLNEDSELTDDEIERLMSITIPITIYDKDGNPVGEYYSDINFECDCDEGFCSCIIDFDFGDSTEIKCIYDNDDGCESDYDDGYDSDYDPCYDSDGERWCDIPPSVWKEEQEREQEEREREWKREHGEESEDEE